MRQVYIEDGRVEEARCPKAQSARRWAHGPALAPHACPFAGEVRADVARRCTCCQQCTHECAMDV